MDEWYESYGECEECRKVEVLYVNKASELALCEKCWHFCYDTGENYEGQE